MPKSSQSSSSSSEESKDTKDSNDTKDTPISREQIEYHCVYYLEKGMKDTGADQKPGAKEHLESGKAMCKSFAENYQFPNE